MTEQLRAIAWLQLQLVRNSASRDLRWLGAFAWVLQIILATVGCIVLVVFAALAGLFAFNGDDAWVLLIVVDGAIMLLCVVRLIMLLVELNESDFIDTQRFLFLPIRLRTLFAINFLVRNFTGLLLIAVPPLISLCIALAFRHGLQMLLGFPLGLAALLAIAGGFDCLREWVLTFGESKAKMLVNLSLIFMSLLIFAVAGSGALAAIRSEAEAPSGVSAEKLKALGESVEIAENPSPISDLVQVGLVRVNTWIPPGWMALGFYRLSQHEYTAAVWGTAGLFGLGLALIAIDYRLVVRRYRDPASADDAGTHHPRIPASRLTGLSIGGLAGGPAAFVGLTCLSRMRSFTVRSSTWFYIVAAIVACVVPFAVDVSGLTGHPLSDIAPFAVVGPIVFFSLALSNNIFGQDRAGFQVLVLMPVDRRTYLWSKNAVTTALVLTWIALVMAPCVLIFRPHPVSVAAALVAALQAQIMVAVIGNGLSIVFPYRLREGVLDQPAQPLAAMLPNLCLLILTPVIFGPVALAAGFGPLMGWVWRVEGAWVSLLVAVLLLLATACLYIASIPGTAALLERREMRMLETLASDRE